MTKRVFFSFHYGDVETFRANVVRNHGITKDAGEAGFFDASIWEDAKKHGDLAVKRLIDTNLANTSVTCALIGTQTWARHWVRYELLKSHAKGNKIFGIHINGITDKNKQTFPQGQNPFNYLGLQFSNDGKELRYTEYVNGWQWFNDIPAKQVSNVDRQHWGKHFILSQWVPVYDWIMGNGYANFPTWVDEAK